MGNFLLDLIFGKLAKALDGKKMYVIGIGFILKGILGLIGHYWPDSGFPVVDVKSATDDIMIGGGFFAGKSAIVKSGPVCK